MTEQNGFLIIIFIYIIPVRKFKKKGDLLIYFLILKKIELTRTFIEVNSGVGSYKYTIIPITYEHGKIK